MTVSELNSIYSYGQREDESLSVQLLSGKMIQTAAMRYGIEHEDKAAQFYSQQFGRETYRVGFVINPSIPHLSCSPNRRVYDPTESQPWHGCALAEPNGPWRLTFALGRLENIFFMQIICWAP